MAGGFRFRDRMIESVASLVFATLFFFFFFFFFVHSVSYAAAIGLTNSSIVVAADGCIEMERNALLTFKQHLHDPSARLSSWVGPDCCGWKGVSCSKVTGNVLKLDLSFNVSPFDYYHYNSSLTLGGKLNPSLLQLKQLTYLNLSNNDFDGESIPDFLESFKKLIYLDLSSSSFTGTVPPHLGNLSNLRHLDLSDSSFTGTVPPHLGNLSNLRHLDLQFFFSDFDLHWVSRLSLLKYINLDGLDLSLANTHWLHALNMIPSLSVLHLSNCQLQNLPLSLPFFNLTSLSIIDLSENSFNSSVPQYLFNMSKNLKELNLNNCELKGIFDKVVRGDVCNFRLLNLEGNHISNEIDEFLMGLSKCNNHSMEELDLSDNQLYGQFPINYQSVKLRSLHLSSNKISGPLPASIHVLSNLEVLQFNSNKLSGSIPESCFQNLTKLITLDLSDNGREGTLSENHFLSLTKLKYFDVSSSSPSNGFHCNFSHNWNPPFSLEALFIKNCMLGPPEFPAWLQRQTQLRVLRLRNVGLMSAIPAWFSKLSPQMEYLDLSSNQISGAVPLYLDFHLRRSGNGVTIDWSYNRLEGLVPIWPNVDYLRLGGNLFSGSIPENIGHVMSSTRELSLSGNHINGSIPNSIVEMKDLVHLDLSNNSLSGTIPDLQVSVLDLSRNNLSGSIPASMCASPYVRQLRLSSNNLSGELPLKSHVRRLRLSSNNLSGELPFSLRNCTSLFSLDISNNKFSGEIPKWIDESFSFLAELEMRGNRFTGNVPQQLCHLPNLHLLDLSLNDLSGPIPSCLGNFSRLIYSDIPNFEVTDMAAMEVEMKGRELVYLESLILVYLINLSGHKLSGEIPEEVTKLILLGTLNLSGNHLTGKIPQKIGESTQLETLDLSCNHISGTIPPSMVSLTLLSHLNLSHNNLSGTIPTANQLLTFDDASIFTGNPGLCGKPLTDCAVPCQEDNGCKIIDKPAKGEMVKTSMKIWGCTSASCWGSWSGFGVFAEVW